MLRVELSALSVPELKRLLEMARARDQAPLVAQLEAELAARPTRMEDWTPAPTNYASRLSFEPEEPLERPRRNGVMAATAVLAAMVSAAVTWGLSVPMTPRGDTSPARAEPTPRAAVVLASLAPPKPPAAVNEVAAVRSPEPETVERAPVRVAKAEPRRRARENPCLDLATSAERLVCGYPKLAAQDRQLRTAYERALAAGADRRDLDRAQAQWRGDGEKISDPKQLADRYTRRIHELEAAAVRPPPEEPPY